MKLQQTPPKVSVGIRVYNAEKYIEKCAESLFSQTLPEMEFIFVDDASPDHSMEILLQTLARFPARKDQVKMIRHERNLGVMAGCKHLLENFSGEYFIFCDPDDTVDSDMYRAMYEKAKRRDADVVHCGYITIGENGKKSSVQEGIIIDDMSTYLFYVHSNRISLSLVVHMFKRQISPDILYLPQHITICEDYLLLSQLLSRCRTVACLENGFYRYFRHSGSVSHGNIKHSLRCFRFVLRYLDRTDPAFRKARESRWRVLLYRELQNGLRSPARIKAYMRHCGKDILTDETLKRKKRIRLFLLRFCPGIAPLLFGSKKR